MAGMPGGFTYGSPVVTFAGSSSSNYGILGATDSPSDILLPTYLNSLQIEQQNPPALLHLSIFDGLRDSIDKARRCLFAAKGSKLKRKAQLRIELTGDERSFDYTLAVYMYSRDISGDFGTRGRAQPAFDLSTLSSDATVAAAVRAAESRLNEINDLFRKHVLGVLEERLVKGDKFGHDEESSRLSSSFWRRPSFSFRGGYADCPKLATFAGPWVKEAKEIHLTLEKVLLESIARFEKTAAGTL